MGISKISPVACIIERTLVLVEIVGVERDADNGNVFTLREYDGVVLHGKHQLRIGDDAADDAVIRTVGKLNGGLSHFPQYISLWLDITRCHGNEDDLNPVLYNDMIADFGEAVFDAPSCIFLLAPVVEIDRHPGFRRIDALIRQTHYDFR